jgi:ATP-dependent Clp protease ATP-binding subunit ClpX
MFELPSRNDIEEVVVKEEAVTSLAKPILVLADKKKGSASVG